MRDSRSHLRITKMMFPHIDDDTIRRTNHAIDNPTTSDVLFANMMNAYMGPNAGKIQGMYRGGHRAYNHDMFSAMLKGFQTGGINGMNAAMAHMGEDLFNDMIVKSVGSDWANVFESLFLATTNKQKRRR